MKTEIVSTSQFQVSEVQLSYNPKVKASQRKQITTSRETYLLLSKGWDSNKIQFVEQFKVVLLNNNNKVLGVYENSCGGTTSTVVDVRLVFAAALLANSKKIILAHNHPSGSLKPSHADLKLTARIKDAGELLDIQVLDHLIITAEGYYSLADEGLL